MSQFKKGDRVARVGVEHDPGTSFCFEPGEDPSLMLAASQPIGASS